MNYTIHLHNHALTDLNFATREEAEKAHLACDFNTREIHVVETMHPVSARLIFDGDQHLLELVPHDWKDGLFQHASRIRRPAQNTGIVVTRRSGEFYASIKGNSDYRTSRAGKTRNEAVGALVIAHPNVFGIVVETAGTIRSST